MTRAFPLVLLLLTAAARAQVTSDAGTPDEPSTAPPPALPEGVAAPAVKPAPPAEERWYDRVKLSGRAFVRYSVELPSGAPGFNEFAVDRLYLTSEFKVLDDV